MFGVLLFSLSCNNIRKVADSTSKDNFEILFISEYGGSGEDETKIYSDNTNFTEMWNSTINQFSGLTEVPFVDFSKNMVVVKSFESQRTGGFEYKVESVSQSEGNTVIFYSASSPGNIGTTAITNPLIIVTVKKQETPEVSFILKNAK